MANNSIKKQFTSKSFKAGGYSLAISAVVLVLVVIINVVVTNLPSTWIKYDLTSENYFTVSDTTKDMLKNLDEDITLYFLESTSSSGGSIVTEFIDRYAAMSEHVKVETVDPVLHPDFYKEFTDTAPSGNSVIVKSEKRSKVVDYSEIVVTETSIDYSTYQQTSSSYFDGEQAISSAIDYVTTDNLPVAYYIGGHAELELPDDFTASIADDNISLSELKLLETENGIPSDAQAVIIFCPESDYSTDEIQMLEDYITSGGNIMLVTEYSADLPNIFAFAENHGLEYVPGVVFEASQSKYYQYPYYVIPTISANDITGLMPSDNITILYPLSHGIREVEGTECSVTPLFTTSTDSYSKVITESTSVYEYEDGDEKGSFMLGALSLDSENNGQLVWFSSPNAVYPIYNNLDYATATVDYFCEKEASVAIAARKSLSVTPLSVPTSSASLWMVILCIALPLTTIITGLVIWANRRKR